MDRRDFLKQGALMGLAGAGAATFDGCATTGLPSAANVPSVDMPDYLARLDVSMDVIGHADFFQDLVAVAHPVSVGSSPLLHQREVLTRKALRSLTITGAFLDLNADDRSHPGIQARLWNSLSEMDEATQEMARELSALPQDTLSDVQTKLRTQPNILSDLTRALDDKAALAGLSSKRRRHVQRLMGQIGWRLREEGPGGVIQEYVDGVAKASREAARNAQSADDSSGGTASGPPPSAGTVLPEISVGAPVTAGVEIQQYEPRPRNRHGRGLATAGGITLGLSVVGGLAGIGALLAAGSSGVAVAFGLVSITLGALGLIGGLIVLIIGLTRL